MKSTAAATEVTTRPASITVAWSDGTAGEFASVWLRDNLPEDRDRHSGQRLIDVMDIPEAPRIRSATLTTGALEVDWVDEPRRSSFDLRWLYECANGGSQRPELQTRLWLDGAARVPQRDFGWLAFAELQTDPRARLGWLTRLLQDGIAFLSEVPCHNHAILEATAYMGYVPETNYGRVFDVRAVPQPENLAYSDLGLGLHTDNPYREPVPGFQALHTILAAPDGGDSLFADGFAIAEHLRKSEPGAFETISRTPVPFWYRAAGVDLYAERPLVELSCTGHVTAVTYNNRAIRPVRLPASECAGYYLAYRKFAALLRDPRLQMATRLNDGELTVFDNRRVLHGRTGFASARHPRHLQGCYLTRDSVYSQAAVLRHQLEGGVAG
jgi:alpha-ketoglutarate-dependent taurine dioxygenase